MRSTIILARNLRAYRALLNLSQEETAKMVHMSVRGYGKIERCEVAPSLDTLDKLACGLHMSPSLLVSEDTFVSPVREERRLKRTKKKKDDQVPIGENSEL